MLLSVDDIREDIERPTGKKEYNIIFVGMSNFGKTYWSDLLAKAFGYEHVQFDELIDASPEIKKFIEGKDGAERMGKWFGMSWEPGFQKKEDRFLEVEEGFMSED